MSEAREAVFVSYAHEDQELVLRFVARLREVTTVWVDSDGIVGGRSWREEIAKAVRGCQVCLLMVSQASLASEVVVCEISLAHELQKPICCLRLDDTALPDSLALALIGGHYLETRDPNLGDCLPNLIRTLRSHGVPVAEKPGAVPETPLSRGNLDPRPQTPFFDRCDERQDICRWLQDGYHVVIEAGGGTGKTRLAHEAARDLLEQQRFPDGVYRLDLRGAPDLGAEEMATRLCNLLSVRPQAGLPDPLWALERLCHDRQALLWVDNCDSVTSIGGLLGIASHLGRCRVLVTSRRSIALAEARSLPLHPLPEPDAARLMLECMGGHLPEGATLADLALVCDEVNRLPLAVEVLAGIIRELPEWSLPAVLARVRSLDKDERMHACFQLQYDSLSAQAQHCLMATSLLAASSFDAALVQRIVSFAGLTVPAVTAVLEGLVRVYLLSALPDGYTLHPLVKGFAAGQLAQHPDRDRMHQGYLALLEYLLVDPDRDPTALRRFRDDFAQGVGWALDLGWHEAALSLTLKLIGEGLDHPTGPGARLGWWELMLGFCHRLAPWLGGPTGPQTTTLPAGREALLGLLHKSSAFFAYWLGDNDHCLKEAEEAQRWYGKAGDTAGEAVAVQLEGYLCDDTCDYADAESAYREGLALAKESGDAKLIALSHHLVGCSLYHQMREEEAEAEFGKALDCRRYARDRLCWSRTRRRVAAIRLRQQRWDEAQEILDECLTIERAHASMRDWARTLRHLGRLALARPEPDLAAAERYLQEAREYMEEIMNLRGIGAILLNQATLWRLQGQPGRGLEAVESSLGIAHKLGARYGQALCLMEQAALQRDLGQPAAACAAHEAAVAILQALHLQRAIAQEEARIGWSGADAGA